MNETTMKRESMGSYFERSVTLEHANGLDEVGTGGMDHAAVLLWLGDDAWDAGELERAIGRFITRGALNLTISGRRAGESFGVLMETVSQLQGDFITVLNVLSGLAAEEAVEEFLKHAAPGEAQLKAWREYRVVQAGGDDAIRARLGEAIGRCVGARV